EGGTPLAEAGKEVAERVLETDRRLYRGMDDCVVLVREQLGAREGRAGENLRKRVVASGRIGALGDTGKVAPRNLRDGVPGRTVEPDQVVVRILDIADERNRAPLPVEQVVEGAQDRILIGHPVEGLRDGHRG